jgi:hypothetical protein
MPKISSYGTVTPSPSDKIVVSDANDSNATKNITVGSLSSATAPTYYVDAYSNIESLTTISQADTYVDLNVTLSQGLADGYSASGNLVTNTNTPQTTLLSQVTVAMTLSTGNNNVVTTLLSNNGVDIVASTQDSTAPGAGDDFILTMTCITNVVYNQALRVRIKNSDATNITCKHINFVVHSI